MVDDGNPWELDEDELHFSFVRSSGPGGQNVNKSNTCAVLRWFPSQSRAFSDDAMRARFMERYASRMTTAGEFILSCDTHRSQMANRRACIARLKTLIAEVAEPPKPRKPVAISRSAKERRLRAKRSRATLKQNRQKIDYDD